MVYSKYPDMGYYKEYIGDTVMEKQKSGMATAGLVLGIIGICTSFIVKNSLCSGARNGQM